ncbi:MAG: cobalamin-dependent protein [Deltaproteobacteria bacterium]|nr:cobalamin-dependent protein [Deltaproteobacteria bacterium]
MSKSTLEKLQAAILELDEEESVKLTRQAIDDGINPIEVVEKGLRPCLTQMGKGFEAYEIALPELVIAGDIAGEIGEIVEQALVGNKDALNKGTIVIGTVRGDLHAIGKNIVAVIMKAYGYKVIDLGEDVHTEEFMEVAPDVDAVCLSGLLSLATRSMKETIAAVKATYPDKIIITGGAAMDPTVAEALGIFYGTDAAAGVSILDNALLD